MKIQCSCGAKYEFEVQPEMARAPVRFVCPACGLDASEFVDGLVRRELGQTSTPEGVAIPVQVGPPSPASGAPPVPESAPPQPRVAARVHTAPAQASPAQPETAAASAAPLCV